jgi:hypothetical protein
MNGNRIAQSNFKDFTPTSPTTPTILGFMWNDFSITGDEENLTIFPGQGLGLRKRPDSQSIE